MKLDLLRNELIRDEGLKLTAYKDSVGLWTIGVGHLLGDEQRMTEITTDEAHALLEWDIRIAQSRLAPLISPAEFDALSDPRQRALINMAFNLGHRLGQFKKFWMAFTAKDWTASGKEMMDSKWAVQVGTRAERLRDMIVTG